MGKEEGEIKDEEGRKRLFSSFNGSIFSTHSLRLLLVMSLGVERERNRSREQDRK